MLLQVDVEPKQVFCTSLAVFYYDFKNRKKYFFREGESSVEYYEEAIVHEKVKKNANKR